MENKQLDLIDRNELLNKSYWRGNPATWYDPYPEGEEVVDVSDIENAPTVDAVLVVHGRWERVIPTKSAAKWSIKVSCSACHRQGYTHYSYCPNCGAKMDL